MITQLFLENSRNIKGKASLDLSGLDLFIGPNGSGKSNWLDTIPIVILGYNPEKKGKDYASTFEDSNSDIMIRGFRTLEEMDVYRLQGEFTRKFQIDKTGKIEQTIVIDGTEYGRAAGNKLIAEQLGDKIILFDLDEFLEKSDDRKKEFIFGLGVKTQIFNVRLKIEELFLREIDPDIGGILKYKYEAFSILQLTADQRKELEAIVLDSISEDETDITRIIVSGIIFDLYNRKSEDANSYFLETLKIFNNGLNTHRKLKREYESTKKRLTELQLEKETAPKTLDELKLEFKETQDNIVKLNTEIAVNKKNREVIQNHDVRVDKIKEILADLKKSKKDGKTKQELKKVESDIIKIKEYIEKYSVIKKTKNDLHDLINKYHKITENLVKTKKVGYCIISSEIPCPADFSDNLLAFEEIIEENSRELEEVDSDLNFLEEEIKSKYSKEAIPLSDFLISLETQKKDMESEIRILETSEKSYTEELRELESRDLSQFNVIDDKTLLLQLDGWIKKREELDSQLEALQRIKEARIEIASIELSTDITEQKIKFDKMIISAIRDVMNELLSEILRPLKIKMNELLSQIDKNFKFDIYLDNSEKLVLGWPKDKKTFCVFDNLSKGEKVLYSVALITALYHYLSPPLKALCVKVAELDSTYFKLLLNGLKALKSNFDNILVEYPHIGVLADKPKELEGWKIISWSNKYE